MQRLSLTLVFTGVCVMVFKYLSLELKISPGRGILAGPMPWQAWYLLWQEFTEHLPQLRRGDRLSHGPTTPVHMVVVNVSHMVSGQVTVVPVVSHPHLVLGKVGVLRARTSPLRSNTRSQHHFSQGPETHQTDFPSKCKIQKCHISNCRKCLPLCRSCSQTICCKRSELQGAFT